MDNDVEELAIIISGFRPEEWARSTNEFSKNEYRLSAEFVIKSGYLKTKKEGLVPLDLDKLTHHINIFIKHETHHNKLTFDLLAQTRLSESICSRFSTPNILDKVEVCKNCFGDGKTKLWNEGHVYGKTICGDCQGRGIVLKETK